MATHRHGFATVRGAIAVVFALAFLGGCGNKKRQPELFFKDPQVLELVKAASSGDVETIERLVKAGVDVNARGERGLTPLWWTMRSANKAGFKRLLELGADPNVWADEDFATSSSVMTDAVWLATDTEWLELALKHGGDPNLKDLTGRTPLFRVAISPNRKKVVELLLEAGADVNHQTKRSGDTPLIAAASMNAFDVVWQLIEAGADHRLTDGGVDLAYQTVLRSQSLDPNSDVGIARIKVAAFLEKNGIDLEPIKKRVAKEREESRVEARARHEVMEEAARKAKEASDK
jgi:ankyrin repeat protein